MGARKNRLSGWVVTWLAMTCAAYWLARSGLLGAGVALTAGAAFSAVLLTARGVVARRRRRLLARLAADMRAVSQRPVKASAVTMNSTIAR